MRISGRDGTKYFSKTFGRELGTGQPSKFSSGRDVGTGQPKKFLRDGTRDGTVKKSGFGTGQSFSRIYGKIFGLLAKIWKIFDFMAEF